jgi:TRAP-type C4-dicarboxylate transport system substrate-binding protein
MSKVIRKGFVVCLTLIAIFLGYQTSVLATEVSWKMYLYTGAINYGTQIMQEFAKDISEQTGGKLKIQVYPAKELPYSATQMPQIIRNRDVEMADGLGGFIAGQLPLVGVFDLPFLITDSEKLKKAWAAASPFLNKSLKKFNARVLFPYAWPAQNLWSTVPIDKLDDIKGKKIRCTNRQQVELIKLLGGSPVTMTTSEVPPAVQRKVIEGVLSAAYAILGAKWSDFLDYGYVMDLHLAISLIMVNEEAYEELSPEFKKILDETAIKYSNKLLAAMPNEKEQAARKTLAEQGMRIVNATPQEIDRAKSLIRPHWDKWAEQNGPEAEKMLQAVLEALE